MKRSIVVSIFLAAALLLSSCSMHLGLSKLFNSGSSSQTAKTKKHVKATHTPPSPPNSVPSATETPMPTPGAYNPATIVSIGFTPNILDMNVGTTLNPANDDAASLSASSDSSIFNSRSIKSFAKIT